MYPSYNLNHLEPNYILFMPQGWAFWLNDLLHPKCQPTWMTFLAKVMWPHSLQHGTVDHNGSHARTNLCIRHFKVFSVNLVSFMDAYCLAWLSEQENHICKLCPTTHVMALLGFNNAQPENNKDCISECYRLSQRQLDGYSMGCAYTCHALRQQLWDMACSGCRFFGQTLFFCIIWNPKLFFQCNIIPYNKIFCIL